MPPPLLDGPGPTVDEMQTLLTLAARVPDHGKLAPWRFIVIAGEARARVGEIIAAAFAADNPEAGPDRLDQERRRCSTRRSSSPSCRGPGPHVKIPEWEQVLSAGAVSMNLVVAANAMGYATSWLTEWHAYDRRVLDALGLAPQERLAGYVHIGKGREIPSDRPRPALADIVTTL